MDPCCGILDPLYAVSTTDSFRVVPGRGHPFRSTCSGNICWNVRKGSVFPPTPVSTLIFNSWTLFLFGSVMSNEANTFVRGHFFSRGIPLNKRTFSRTCPCYLVLNGNRVLEVFMCILHWCEFFWFGRPVRLWLPVRFFF